MKIEPRLKEKIKREHLIILVLLVAGIAITILTPALADLISGDSGSDLVAHYRFDYGAKDIAYDTAGDNDGTINGATWVDGKFGKALSFDGNDDYVNIGDQSGNCISDPSICGQMSVFLWVYPTGGDYIISSGGQTGSKGFTIMNRDPTYFGLKDGSYKWEVEPPQLPQNTWSHIGFTWETGGNLIAYVNGKEAGRDSSPSSESRSDSETLLTVGCPNNNLGSYVYQGDIDDVHIYDRALNHSEIKALYNRGAAKIGNETEEAGGKVLDMGFRKKNSTHVFDTSGNENHGLIQRPEQKTAVHCKVGRCYNFDGDDYIESVKGYGAFEGLTMAMWVKFGAGISDYQFPLNSGPEAVWRMGIDASNKLYFDPGSHSDQNPSVSVNPGEWYHYAISAKNTTSGSDYTVYLNGKKVASGSVSTHIKSVDKVFLGRNPGHYSFEGTIDQVKIYDRALSQKEIIQNTRGLSSPGAVLDMRLDAGGGDLAYDNSIHNNNGRLKPNESYGPTWTDGIQGNALNFDGSDDYVKVPSDSSFSNVQQVTLSAWIYPKEYRSWDHPIATKHSNGDAGYEFSMDDNRFLFTISNGTTGNNVDTTLTGNRWYYVTGTYNSDTGVLKLYVNGKLEESKTITPVSMAETDYLAIGARRGGYGYTKAKIDQVQIYPYVLSESKIKQLYVQGSAKIGRKNLPSSCSDLPPGSGSGKYWIDPNGGSPSDAFEVYCEMDENGGGWIKLRIHNDCNNDNMFWFSKYNGIDDQESTHGKIGNQFNWGYLNQLDNQSDLVGGSCNSSTNHEGFDWVFTGGPYEEHVEWEMWGNPDYVYTDEQMDAIRSVVDEISSTTEMFTHTNDDDNCDPNGEWFLKQNSTGAGNGPRYQATWFTSGNQVSEYDIVTEDEMNNYNDVDYLIPSYLDRYNEGGACSGEDDHSSFGYEKNYTLVRDTTGEDSSELVLDQNFDRIETCGQTDTLSCPTGIDGKVVVDKSGLANHGELVNGPVEKSGAECKVGGCLEFTGDNQQVEIPNNGNLNLNGDVTISSWVKMPNPTASWSIAVSQLSGSSGFRFYSHSKGGMRINSGNGTDVGDCNHGGPDLEPNTWAHITAVFDSNTGTWSIYKNGEFYRSDTDGTCNTQFPKDTPVYFSVDEFTGALDEVHIYNRSLSEEEIWHLYTQGRDQRGRGEKGGPVGWWRMDNSVNFGDGSDGSLTVSSQGRIVNDCTYLIEHKSPSMKTLKVDDASDFSAGDEIMIIQMQDGEDVPCEAGQYEFRQIQSIKGNTITLKKGLRHPYCYKDPEIGLPVNKYNPPAGDHTAAVAQVVSIPHYTDVMIQSNTSITAPYWNGSVGGIVAFRATGTVTVNGNITVKGKGFRGGAVLNPGDDDDGGQGEGLTGLGIQGSGGDCDGRAAANGIGGGGSLCINNDGGDPGAAGGYGSMGEDASRDDSPCDLPHGGKTTGSRDLSEGLFFGGGGGGGSDSDDNNCLQNPFGKDPDGDPNSRPNLCQRGGHGGGIVYLAAEKIKGANISAEGHTTHPVFDGGPGGGAGGTIQIKTYNITIDEVNATGGPEVCDWKSDGADCGARGGDGRIRIDRINQKGSTDPILYASPFEAYNLAESNTGNLSGDPQWTSGKVGKALDFDGSDDYVKIPDSTELRAGILTISAWFKPAEKQRGWIINKRNYGLEYNRHGNGEIDPMGRFKSAGFTIKTWDPPTSIVDEWHHITLVWDGAYLIGYFDGDQVKKWDYSGDSLPTSTWPLRLGTWDGTGEFFDGKIDDVRIYPYTLTQEQIKSVYNQGAAKVG